MTISVPGQLVYSSQGDGVTTEFTYPVRFEAASELVVISREDDVDTVLTLNTDYTVAGAGLDAGGTVTMLYTPTAAEEIVRYRDTAAKQIVNLADSTRNPAEAVENQLDRFAMKAQDQSERLSRAVLARPGSAGQTLPEPEADKIIMWDSDGTGLINRTVGEQGELVPGVNAGDLISTNNGSDFADPAETLANLGGMGSATYDPNAVVGDAFDSGNHSFTPTVPAAVARTVADKLNDVRSIFDIPGIEAYRTAIGDGSLVTGLQDFFRTALEIGGNWYVPRGRYYIDLTCDPDITNHVHLIFDADSLVVGDPDIPERLFKLEPTVTHAARIQISGGEFDVSQIVPGGTGSNKGSVMSLIGAAQGSFVSGGRYLAGTGLDALRSDTAIGISNCVGTTVERNFIRGFNDLGIYVTGGNALDRSEEGGAIHIHGNEIRYCANGANTKRGGANTHITDNKIFRSGNVGIGATHVADPQNPDSGHHTIISGNWIKDCVASGVSLRGGIGRHKVHNNIIEDWGYSEDGTVFPALVLAGIDALGCIRSTFQGNTVALVDRDKDVKHVGLNFQNWTTDAGTFNHGGNLVTDNSFEKLDRGVIEREAGDASLLNKVHENQFIDVDTHYEELTTGAFFYDTRVLQNVDLGKGSVVSGGQTGSSAYAVPGLRSKGTVELTLSALGSSSFDARIKADVIVGNGQFSSNIYNGTTITQDFTGRRYNVTIRS